MHIFALYIPQSVIAWVIIGLIAGWLAGTVSRGAASAALPTSSWEW